MQPYIYTYIYKNGFMYNKVVVTQTDRQLRTDVTTSAYNKAEKISILATDKHLWLVPCSTTKFGCASCIPVNKGVTRSF